MPFTQKLARSRTGRKIYGRMTKAFTHALEAGCPFDKIKGLLGFADGIFRKQSAT